VKLAILLLAAGVALSTQAWAGQGCCGISSKAQTLAQADPPAVKAQTTCPVMGNAINKAQYVDYKGKRVYFCCGACPAKFNADPETYLKKLADEGVTLEDTPTAEQK
jgi:YHS domain-containing protein